MSAYKGKRALGKAKTGKRTAYIDGSVARQYEVFDVREAIKEPPREQLSHSTRKNRDKARHMNMGYVIFLVAAMCMMVAAFYGYISLQARNKAMVGQIASLESRLNTLKLDNDEEYSRIMSSVDMNHVKEVAMNELGMQYAQEGQIMDVMGSGDDYVSQYEAMP